MLASAFAAIIAPRKLQSFGKAEHTVAAAVSSVRSTSSVVTTGRIRLEVAGTARGAAMRCLDELEYALRVYLRDAPTKTTSINRDQAIFLFIVMLQNSIRFRRLLLSTLETGGYSAITGDHFYDFSLFRWTVSRAELGALSFEHPLLIRQALKNAK